MSIYDWFGQIHYWAIAPMNNTDGSIFDWPTSDFAHGGPGLLTWHRYYQLLFERQFQKLLDNPSFTLPYWDFTQDYAGTEHDVGLNLVGWYNSSSMTPKQCDLNAACTSCKSDWRNHSEIAATIYIFTLLLLLL
jgi:hypothetical protein